MDQNINREFIFTQRLLSFLKKNKIKFITFIILIFFSIVSLFIVFEKKKNDNFLLSEKYIKAGLLLSDNKKEEAKNKYEEIILSKNKFYSLLAMNTILEKNLVEEKEKVLEYFLILEKVKFSKELYNLILFKKALYLLKLEDFDTGEKILNNLIKEDSSLRSIAQSLIK